MWNILRIFVLARRVAWSRSDRAWGLRPLDSTGTLSPSFKFQSEAFGFLVSSQPAAASSLVGAGALFLGLRSLVSSFNGSLRLLRHCSLRLLVSTVASLPSSKFQSEACGFLVSGNPFGLPVSTQPAAAGSIVLKQLRNEELGIAFQ